MNSCLYECEVMHHRLEPKGHRFRHRIFLCAFDLDEIDALAAAIPVFSHNRRNLYAFRDSDHLALVGREGRPVRLSQDSHTGRWFLMDESYLTRVARPQAPRSLELRALPL